ncbi:MAG: hypothetical protein ACOCXO_00115 [Bacteroidota bacterium]
MKTKKQNFLCLKCIRPILFLVPLFTIIAQCQNPNPKKDREKFNDELVLSGPHDFSKFGLMLKDSFNVDLIDYNYILYFTNNGCVGCNDRYFSILTKNRFKTNVLTIFSGTKRDFDYNQIDTGKANQIIDDKLRFKNLDYLKHPSIILIDTSQIDTIYTVDASFVQFDSIIHTLLKDSSVLYE